jgi:hypothetical protein
MDKPRIVAVAVFFGALVILGTFSYVLDPAAPTAAATISPEQQKQNDEQQQQKAEQQKKNDEQERLQTFIANMLTQDYQKQGFNVTVANYSNNLLFDCSAEPYAHGVCARLYKAPIPKDVMKAYRLAGIREMRYKTEPGVFGGLEEWRRVIQ